MDCMKTGQLICALRKELGYTQKGVADALNISHKTVSKWERGLGMPDVSLLPELSAILGADLQKILEGELSPNRPDTGKLTRLSFYVCPSCGNIVTGTGKCTVSCCGRRLVPRVPQTCEAIGAEPMDGGLYITIDHPMTKKDYIAFIACVSGGQVLLRRLYPEQSCEVWLPAISTAEYLYAYSTSQGLWMRRI